MGDNHYDHPLCPGLQPGLPSQNDLVTIWLNASITSSYIIQYVSCDVNMAAEYLQLPLRRRPMIAQCLTTAWTHWSHLRY